VREGEGKGDDGRGGEREKGAGRLHPSTEGG